MFGAAPSAGPADIPLPSPPADSIQTVAWSPAANHLVSGSWDNVLRVWEVAPNGQGQARVETKLDGPVLDATWSADGTKVFAGGCDKTARMWDLATNQTTQIAQHDAPIKVCRFIPSLNCVMTGSWDKTLKFWDMRQPQPAAQFMLPERCYAADTNGDLCVVATADRHIVVYNLNGGPKEFQKKDTILKMQTRCVSCFPTRDGYAVGSIEGRVAIMYIDPSRASKDDFSFKCHRDDGIHCINSISHHPKYGTFATAGSDGKFIYWDKDSRNRLKPFNGGQAPVTATAFNTDGTMFAYALSYDWSKGHEGYTPSAPNAIMIHGVLDDEVKPKPRPK
eukprot:m.92651 g.92651  ORF g.92651 m.92651 type:complete len:335 (-) comp15339_c0_seq3:193-1197(-)